VFHPVRYWRQDQPDGLQNFGDYLTELFLEELFGAPCWPADVYYLVGSVIREQRIRRALAEFQTGPSLARLAFWGCGARDADGLAADVMPHLTFLGVRGPLTRDALGLPPETVLGDPGLLLPLLVPRPNTVTTPSLCITHFHEPRESLDIQRQTGVDTVTPAALPRSLPALKALIRQIAGAGFVLSGSLHGAIAACAYGVPFAFFDSGYIDVPFKWRDFAASVGIPTVFARSLAEGRAMHADLIAPAYRPVLLTPLLHVAPFHVRPDIMLRAMAHDGLLPSAVVTQALGTLAPVTAVSKQLLREAQSCWLEREYAASRTAGPRRP
jgi:hypothetical protein